MPILCEYDAHPTIGARGTLFCLCFFFGWCCDSRAKQWWVLASHHDNQTEPETGRNLWWMLCTSTLPFNLSIQWVTLAIVEWDGVVCSKLAGLWQKQLTTMTTWIGATGVTKIEIVHWIITFNKTESVKWETVDVMAHRQMSVKATYCTMLVPIRAMNREMSMLIEQTSPDGWGVGSAGDGDPTVAVSSGCSLTTALHNHGNVPLVARGHAGIPASDVLQIAFWYSKWQSPINISDQHSHHHKDIKVQFNIQSIKPLALLIAQSVRRKLKKTIEFGEKHFFVGWDCNDRWICATAVINALEGISDTIEYRTPQKGKKTLLFWKFSPNDFWVTNRTNRHRWSVRRIVSSW